MSNLEHIGRWCLYGILILIGCFIPYVNVVAGLLAFIYPVIITPIWALYLILRSINRGLKSR